MSRSRRSLVVGYDGFSRICALFSVYFGNILRRDLAHGVVERQAQHIDEQVDGVALHATLWPAPEGSLYDQAVVLLDMVVPGAGGMQPQTVSAQQGWQFGDAGTMGSTKLSIDGRFKTSSFVSKH